MNTTKNDNNNAITINHKGLLKQKSTVARFLMVTIALSAVNITTSANVHGAALTNEQAIVRSTQVHYEDSGSKQKRSRYAQGTNAQQQAAMMILEQLVVASSQPRQTREQVMAERKLDAQNEITLASKNKAASALSTKSTQVHNYVEFDIYSASSRLFEDIDFDGYYQTFSVTFDADVYSQYQTEGAQVFADLYLSKDGGPWELYHTTDVFLIIDDTSDDEIEVVTTLDLGYPTGYYDVLVDLYDLGYTQPVATISSEDVDSLYALPLESADRDEIIVVERYSSSVVIAGGSMSIMGMFVMLFAVGLRGVSRRRC